MRVVLDTNVLVSGMIRPTGVPGQVLNCVRNRRLIPIFSEATLAEFVAVIRRPRLTRRYHLTAEDVQTVTGLLLRRCEMVTPTAEPAICRDPKDDRFLAVALASGADAIVSGDEDLLALHPFQGIQIITPREALEELGSLE